MTTETIIYKQQQIDNARPMPRGKSRCGFFTCQKICKHKIRFPQLTVLLWNEDYTYKITTVGKNTEGITEKKGDTYLLGSAGNWIKTNVGKKDSCRPSKHPIHPKGEVPRSSEISSVINFLQKMFQNWIYNPGCLLPSRKFISSPSSLEAKITTSYYDEYHGTHIYGGYYSLCQSTLHNDVTRGD